MVRYLGSLGAQEMCRIFHWQQVVDPALNLHVEQQYKLYIVSVNALKRFHAHNNLPADFMGRLPIPGLTGMRRYPRE